MSRCSPDLYIIDFFLWGARKSAVDATPVHSDMDLVPRLVCAAADIQQNPDVFKSVRRSLARRCIAMVETVSL